MLRSLQSDHTQEKSIEAVDNLVVTLYSEVDCVRKAMSCIPPEHSDSRVSVMK